MSSRIVLTAIAATTLLASCATVQENPNYQYSTKYKSSSPYGAQNGTPTTQSASHVTTVTTQPVTYVQTQPAGQVQAQNAAYVQTTTHTPQSYQSQSYATQNATAQATYTQLDHRCLRRETNRQIIGGAVGGTVGAVLGKKVIGGTKGTAAGAILGGAAGYGIGDKSINCDPIQVLIPQQSATVSPAYYPTQTIPQPQMVHTASNVISAPTDAAMPSTISSAYGTPGYQAMLNAQANDMNALTPSHSPVSAPTVIDARSDTTGQYGSFNSSTIMSGQHHIIEGDTVYSLSRKLCTSIDEIKKMNSLSTDFKIKLGDTINLPASKC